MENIYTDVRVKKVNFLFIFHLPAVFVSPYWSIDRLCIKC